MSKLGSLFPEGMKPAAERRRARGAKGAPAAPEASTRRTCVKDLAAGQEVEGIYLVQDASLRAAKNGSKYVQAAFSDRSGAIPVRHWDANDTVFRAYTPGGYIRVRGRIETYQNRLQMIAFEVQEADPALVDEADFLPFSSRDPAEMEKELDELLASFSDPDYQRLLEAIFSDPAVRPAFLKGPAAMVIHHAWVGGLLEHVLSASKAALQIAAERPFLNRDLLLAGVLLHDIGKIEELDPGPGFRYTDAGRLLGHIAMGALLVERHVIRLEDFPRKKRNLILHLILSHHGTREFGSPVLPCTAEAVVLHHLECLDAKAQGIQTLIEKDRESGNTGAWTDFARVVDGRIYKG